MKIQSSSLAFEHKIRGSTVSLHCIYYIFITIYHTHQMKREKHSSPGPSFYQGAASVRSKNEDESQVASSDQSIPLSAQCGLKASK